MTPDFAGFAQLTLTQLWQVTIVAVGAGAVVKLCCRNRPRLAYALWMLVILKSTVPPCWSSPTGLFSWAMAGYSTAQSDSTGIPPDSSVLSQVIGPHVRHANVVEGEAKLDLAIVDHLHLALIAIWFVGFVLCAAFVLTKQVACSALIRRSRRPLDERYVAVLGELSRRLGVRRHVRLIVTSRPIGPAVFGLVRPAILMPEALLSGNSHEWVQLVLAHELVHVRRGDIIAGKLQLVAQLVWWFHPLIWWANREACRERERCCDEEVVSSIGCKPARYARALLSVLEQKSRLRPLVALPGVRPVEVTSRRLESIMSYAKTDQRRATLVSRVVFATGAIVLVPGMGLTLRAHPSVADKVDETVQTAPAKSTTGTLIKNAHRPEDKRTEAQGADSRWRAQQVVARKAEANYHKARLTREIAEIVALEYEEGIFKQDLATVEGEIKLAESDLSRSKDRVEWARRMLEKGFVPPATVTAEELARRKGRFALEQAQSRKKVLVDYTKGKTIKELRSEVEKARSDERKKKGTWEQEKSKESVLEREAVQSRPAQSK